MVLSSNMLILFCSETLFILRNLLSNSFHDSFNILFLMTRMNLLRLAPWLVLFILVTFMGSLLENFLLGLSLYINRLSFTHLIVNLVPFRQENGFSGKTLFFGGHKLHFQIKFVGFEMRVEFLHDLVDSFSLLFHVFIGFGVKSDEIARIDGMFL